jgi:hypothetical protein
VQGSAGIDMVSGIHCQFGNYGVNQRAHCYTEGSPAPAAISAWVLPLNPRCR